MTATASALLLTLWIASPAAAQDWRTSAEDPCACTDSMPFIIGPRPLVNTPNEIAAMVGNSRHLSCRVARLAVEALRDARDVTATTALLDALRSPACAIRASAVKCLSNYEL